MSELKDRLMANGSADIEKFTDMIQQLLNATWGTDWGVFSEEFPTGNTPEEHPMPHITFNLISRKKAPGRSLKKQAFANYPDPEHEGESIVQSREWFDCIVEFRIFGRTNQEARKITENFEALLETYKGFLKSEGISEILFDEEASMTELGGISRQGLPERVLRYKISIERIFEVRSHTLKEVGLLLKAVDLDLQIEGHKEGYAARIGDDPKGLSNISKTGTPMGSPDFLSIYEKNFPK